jgi:signal transduction histidine kinase
MSSYAQLARLPEPKIEAVNLADCIARVIQLETRHQVNLLPGQDTEVYVDPAQLEQILINLMRNAVEAAAVTGGAVEITWHRSATAVEISVLDEGPGLAATANLFVPFFTTKPTGSGIGLALSKQIAEAHGGRLTLENRKDHNGCVATLKLPRTPSARVLGTRVDDKETS